MSLGLLAASLTGGVATGDAGDDDQGVVLFSTAGHRCRDFPTDVRIERKGRGASTKGLRSFTLNNFLEQSDLPQNEGFGQVHAVKLRRGNYWFRESMSNPLHRASPKPVAVFSVEPRDVVYIGQLFMSTSCDMRGSRYVVVNKFDRDLEVAAGRDPSLSERPITIRLMTLSETALRPYRLIDRPRPRPGAT